MKKIILLLIILLLVFAAAPLSANAASIPVIVIKSFKAEPYYAAPGEVFTLQIALANQGKRDASNVSLTIGGADKAKTSDEAASGETANFLPVESGNIIYIKEIKKGKEKIVTMKLASRSDTAPGIYDLDITVKYAYSRLRFSDSFKIGLTIKQEESLVLKGLAYPSEIMLGDTAVISGDIVNISNGSLKAVTVDYEGEGLEKKSEFYGIFEPNNSDTIENTFKPEKAGVYKISITVSYYDGFGKKTEITRDISVNVKTIEKPVSDKSGNGAGFDILSIIKLLFGLGG